MSDKVEDLETARKAKQRRARDQVHSESRDKRSVVRELPARDPVLAGVAAGDWVPDETGMPPHSPVRPLGYDGGRFYFLDGRGIVVELGAKTGKGEIDALFTPYKNFPVWAWPRFSGKGKERHVNGNFDAEHARQDLFRACALAGAWSPTDRVRGRGAWADEGGRLVLHLGDVIQTAEGRREPGLMGEHVYPGAAAMVRPGPFEPAGQDGVGESMLRILESWNWMRGPVDARLALGWLFLAPLGGALPWRPYIFVTGDQGSGKSTFMRVAEFMLGGGMLKSEDATEAGIAQTLGHDALPVALDELENEHDGKKAQAIMRMARRAASGSTRIRGGSDHKAASFTIRASFLFGAIIMPSMGEQDMARMAMLALRPFAGKLKRKPFDAAELAAYGQALFGRAVKWWEMDGGAPRFYALLDLVRDALIDDGGHDDRGADTFGYLIAGYWAATSDDMPDAAALADICGPLAKGKLSEYEGIKPGWRKCLDMMLDTQPRSLERQAHGSVREILKAWRDDRDGNQDLFAVRKQLRKVGLAVRFFKGSPKTYDYAHLFVPRAHPMLAELFDRTDWRAHNPAGEGGWTNALRGGPTEWIHIDKSRIDQQPHPVRGTSVLIGEIVGYPKESPKHQADEENDDE